jgi:hypothetical protein
MREGAAIVRLQRKLGIANERRLLAALGLSSDGGSSTL